MSINFLRSQSTKSLKREIRNIVDSYSHPWDILAELCQNSVDAIKKWERENSGVNKKHEIIIEINQKEKSIRITDSGCGFDPEKVPSLLAPNETDKDEDEFIGEKGVGLTFVIFSSNKFVLNTKSVKGSYSCEIRNANNWVNSSSTLEEDIPKIEHPKSSMEKNDPEDTYTDIKVEDVKTIDEGLDIFEISPIRIEYLLRTKTAIGYTGRRFNKGNLEVSVILKIVTRDGKELKPKNIPFDYWFPDEFFSKKDIVDFDDFLSKAATLSDAQKSRRLHNKCMMIQGSETKSGKEYRYYGFFVPSRKLWTEIAEKYGLLDETYSGEDGNDERASIDVQPGIFVSTRGMPTGIELVPPGAGAMGYWRNFFILIENDSFKFDIGRKSIPGRSQPPIKSIAKEKFDKLSRWKQWLAKDKTPDIKEPEISELERKSEFDEIRKLPDLNLDEINYIKYPGKQEAAVVAIFHELIGAGVLIGYHGLSEGYKKNYDFWGEYKIQKDNIGKNLQKKINSDVFKRDIVIEFKYDASDIIDDVMDNRKYFVDMDLLVCWDIDHEKFAENHVNVEPIAKEDVLYYGSNYYLEFPATYDLGASSRKPIISLKVFIEELKRQKGNVI